MYHIRSPHTQFTPNKSPCSQINYSVLFRFKDLNYTVQSFPSTVLLSLWGQNGGCHGVASRQQQTRVNQPWTSPRRPNTRDLCENSSRVVNVTLPGCPWGFQAVWTTAISPHNHRNNPAGGRRWRDDVSYLQDNHIAKYLLLPSSGPQHTRVLIVSCYVIGEVIPARCPGCKEWEDNRWTASAFFHHSQNVPPPLTSAPVHQRDNDIQPFPTWIPSR